MLKYVVKARHFRCVCRTTLKKSLVCVIRLRRHGNFFCRRYMNFLWALLDFCNLHKKLYSPQKCPITLYYVLHTKHFFQWFRGMRLNIFLWEGTLILPSCWLLSLVLSNVPNKFTKERLVWQTNLSTCCSSANKKVISRTDWWSPDSNSFHLSWGLVASLSLSLTTKNNWIHLVSWQSVYYWT